MNPHKKKLGSNLEIGKFFFLVVGKNYSRLVSPFWHDQQLFLFCFAQKQQIFCFETNETSSEISFFCQRKTKPFSFCCWLLALPYFHFGRLESPFWCCCNPFGEVFERSWKGSCSTWEHFLKVKVNPKKMGPRQKVNLSDAQKTRKRTLFILEPAGIKSFFFCFFLHHFPQQLQLFSKHFLFVLLFFCFWSNNR